MKQRLDQGLVANSPFPGQLSGPLDIRNRQPDGDVLRGHGAAAAVLEQQIGNQVLMPVPLLRLLGFGAEFRRIDQNGFNVALLRLHSFCLPDDPRRGYLTKPRVRLPELVGPEGFEPSTNGL